MSAATVFGGRHLLARQAEAARQVIGTPHGWTAPDADRTYKKRYGDPIHPSSKGYKCAAKATLPSVLAALHVRDDVPFGHHAPGSAAP